MRVILVATGFSSNLLPLVAHRPSPLLRILDKPIIEHIIEFLSEHKLKRFDLILSHFPHMLEEYLQNGSRWGIDIQYHLVKESQHPFTSLWPVLDSWEEETILFGKADTLPQFEIHKEWMHKEHISIPHLFYYPSKEWSGWGVFPLSSLKSIPNNTHDNHFLEHFKHVKAEKALPFLSVRTFLDLQKTNEKLLQNKGNTKLFPMTTKMVESGIWISRGTTLHPSTRLKAPVFIGENCQVKQHTILGPNAIIENNCVIDQKTVVDSSLVCQRSYVGEGLEVRNSIVDRTDLIHLSYHTHIEIHEDFILGEFRTPSFREYLLKSIGRYFAVLLVVIFSPIFVLLYASRHLHKQPMLLLPAAEEPRFWKTFGLFSFSKMKKKSKNPPKGFLNCLPMLFNIIKGELYFTGVPPRSCEEVEQLTQDWKRLYLGSKSGLITLAMVEQDEHPTADELYASETFYTFNRGLWYDIVLCMRWLSKSLFGIKTQRHREHKE